MRTALATPYRLPARAEPRWVGGKHLVDPSCIQHYDRAHWLPVASVVAARASGHLGDRRLRRTLSRGAGAIARLGIHGAVGREEQRRRAHARRPARGGRLRLDPAR